MNKVFNINLGGFPFTIDEDAFHHLNNYLETIHNHFRQSEGYEEITTDIETRMAELFLEKLGNRPIVMVQDVKHVITIMGTPEDFGAEPMAEEAPEPKGKKWKFKTGKRLFRNPDDEVIAGVCSGIAAYLGIQDPLWVRLFFGILLLTGGFAVPFYIILWIALPKAETAGDRLSMRGEPANVSNIGKIIEEEFGHVSKKVNEIGEELKAEFSSKKKSTTSQSDEEDEIFGSQNFRAATSEGIHLIGTVIRAVIEVLQKIIRPIAFIIGIGLVFILAILWLVMVGGTFWGLPFSSFLFPNMPVMTTLGVVNILVFLGVPLLMMILTVMRLFMNTGFKPRWAFGLWAFWLVNVVSLFFLGTSTVKQFSTSSTVNLGANNSFADIDTLFIDLGEDAYNDAIFRIGDELTIVDKTLVSSNISLDIEKSKTGSFELVQKSYSRGTNPVIAQELANEIQYEYKLEGNRLTLPRNFVIPKGKLWRGQKAMLTLRVPEGKWLKIQETSGMHDIVNRIEEDEQYRFPSWEFKSAWQMGPNGMICPDHIKNEKETYSFSDFNKIRLDGKIKLRIRHGDSWQVRILRGSDYSSDIEITQLEDRLSIYTNVKPSEPILLEIILPDLTAIEAYDSDDIDIRDFQLPNLRLVNHGNGEIKAFVDVEDLQIDLKGNNQMDLRGNGRLLKVIADNDADINAGHFHVNIAEIEVINGSKAVVSVSDTLRQKVDNRSELISRRKPVVIK